MAATDFFQRARTRLPQNRYFCRKINQDEVLHQDCFPFGRLVIFPLGTSTGIFQRF
jgi:hypothetical protein